MPTHITNCYVTLCYVTCEHLASIDQVTGSIIWGLGWGGGTLWGVELYHTLIQIAQPVLFGGWGLEGGGGVELFRG